MSDIRIFWLQCLFGNARDTKFFFPIMQIDNCVFVFFFPASQASCKSLISSVVVFSALLQRGQNIANSFQRLRSFPLWWVNWPLCVELSELPRFSHFLRFSGRLCLPPVALVCSLMAGDCTTLLYFKLVGFLDHAHIHASKSNGLGNKQCTVDGSLIFGNMSVQLEGWVHSTVIIHLFFSSLCLIFNLNR